MFQTVVLRLKQLKGKKCHECYRLASRICLGSSGGMGGYLAASILTDPQAVNALAAMITGALTLLGLALKNMAGDAK